MISRSGIIHLLKTYQNRIIVILFDTLMIPIAWLLTYWLHFNLSIISIHAVLNSLKFMPFIIGIQITACIGYKQYRGVWYFASIPDLVLIIKSVFTGTFCSIITLYFYNHLTEISRSIFPIYVMLLIALQGGGRLTYRWVREHAYFKKHSHEAQRVLIIGAGKAGESLARDLKRGSDHLYHPIAFIDNDSKLLHTEIQKIPVVGNTANIEYIVKKFQIDLAVIAIPSATTKQMRYIVEQLSQAKIKFQTLPNLNNLASGKITLQELRDVSLEDLLGRDEITLDRDSIQSTLVGKKIVVTGGGGSIGSELCRQILSFNPESILIIDHSEFNLYQIDQELRNRFFKIPIQLVLLNITDELALRKTMNQYRPDIIFHAAAYKHVPMLESQIRCAIKNNLLGTQLMADIAIDVNVKKFIMVSTDKAVNPSNIMGATKRAAEIYCQNLNSKSHTKFITVRFGNVLGSAGSVIPLFKKQLGDGGPITVTHPDMTRYFMLIPEACQLILQASALGHGGEIFVLDMGEPIKISFLAEQLVRLSGKEAGKDIDITFTGLRPGEKLYEELFYEEEPLCKTQHEKIFMAQCRSVDWSLLTEKMTDIAVSVSTCNDSQLYQLLKDIVPEMQHQDSTSLML